VGKPAIRRWSSGTPYEEPLGYSRVVRAGETVYVSGCTAIRQDGVVEHPGDVYGQTIATLRRVESALAMADARLEHVVRTRVFLTDISELPAAARAHREVLGDVRPAMLLLEVGALAEAAMLVQIEVDAYVGGES
jgi:enamine deaminase RidA (YjgF/YER057c/UK114 family)